MTTSGDAIAIDGSRKARDAVTRSRLRIALAVILAIFAIMAVRLVALGMTAEPVSFTARTQTALLASRPVLLDRNGLELAFDIHVPSLYAEPRRIIDVPEAARAILSVLPALDRKWLEDRLDGEEGFVWIRRELTPRQRDEIMALGIPGLGFLEETRRFYPGGATASHVLGAVNVDNAGIAGIEHYLDRDLEIALLQELGLARGQDLAPVHLSLDLRVQHILRDELSAALERYQAKAAAGAIMDVASGEIVALVSLPDFDPNQPASMLREGRFNRITAAKFEVASIFKAITIAGALDADAVSLDDTVDASTGVRFGRHTISDYYGQNRVLTVPEVFRYSSNIGTIRIMEAMGKEAFRAFLTRMGFDDIPHIEIPETTTSAIPQSFSDVVAATASFGHGLSVTPLQMLSAQAALVNGGYLVPPTLLRQETQNVVDAPRVLKAETSAQIRYLLRLNALEGSARRADGLAQGYRLGGKTGTAEKVVNGRYSGESVTTFFAASFPMDAPQYTMIVMIDEPQPEGPGTGRTAAWNAGDTTGRIIARAGPMLAIIPEDAAAQ
ncbi:peptidoglycan D,D-transpeptidase FtsI family protein [Pelagibacterium lacus]|uniref:Penicillin-binding protein 2 n=1 Tax=Pelagibacterium lacus TaxID=2282655 RepID=A0A369W5S6_9HYPH|nr:penicillin-binding protein 2 [Pelagibacterium lacus]RDE08612.1 penicillin-binding protein 2 [Pelagibacterium lacus]